MCLGALFYVRVKVMWTEIAPHRCAHLLWVLCWDRCGVGVGKVVVLVVGIGGDEEKVGMEPQHKSCPALGLVATSNIEGNKGVGIGMDAGIGVGIDVGGGVCTSGDDVDGAGSMDDDG
ncbi:hypothetical protein Tco_0607670 [Tanacetum coccineum]